MIMFIVLIIAGYGLWSDKGCYVTNEFGTNVMCQCNHLTSFAILLVSLISIHTTVGCV